MPALPRSAAVPRSTHAAAPILRTILLAAASVSCTGSIGMAEDLAPGASDSTPGSGNTPSTAGAGGHGELASSEGPLSLAPSKMKRLTVAQYTHSLRDLLGSSVVVPADIETDTLVDGFDTVGASEEGISQQGSEQFDTAARDVAHRLFADHTAGASMMGCTPQTSQDPCVRSFVSSLGAKAFRRPLETNEVEAYVGLASNVEGVFSDVWSGVEYAVAGMLVSPKFLFRTEMGHADPAVAGRLRYDGYETAARLSFFLWDAPPDQELTGAAGRGELATSDGIAAQARRLLSSSLAHDSTTGFFSHYLRLGMLDHVVKDAATYPKATPTLGASMRREVELMLDAIAFGHQDFRGIFDNRQTFVNDELAGLYGLPGGTVDFQAAALPAGGPRAGLLGTAAFLTLNANTILTSPTKRGRFIREQLLCQEIPPPPPTVAAVFVDPPGNVGPRTMRDRVAQHMKDPTCASCHHLMDPLGLPLEHFDAIGAYRDTDNGLAIDATGDLDGTVVDGEQDVARALKANPKVATCLARKAYRSATGTARGPDEDGSADRLGQRFQQAGYDFTELLVAIVTSEGFRFAAPSPDVEDP